MAWAVRISGDGGQEGKHLAKKKGPGAGGTVTCTSSSMLCVNIRNPHWTFTLSVAGVFTRSRSPSAPPVMNTTKTSAKVLSNEKTKIHHYK